MWRGLYGRLRYNIRPSNQFTGAGLSLSGTYFPHLQPVYRHCPRFLRC